MRACLADGSPYYFHLNKLEGCWEKPAGFTQNSLFLDQRQIQVTRRQRPHAGARGAASPAVVGPV